MFRFFIDSPIFASVISIVIILAGGMALSVLPIEQYPDLVPPQVVVSAVYPGANAQVMAEAVAAPLEQEINGVDDMLYVESTAMDDGYLQIVITFAFGTDPDQATINVNNRVQAGLSRLPRTVRDLCVRVESRSTNILMLPVLYSPDNSRDPLFSGRQQPAAGGCGPGGAGRPKLLLFGHLQRPPGGAPGRLSATGRQCAEYGPIGL
ncbi:efflux RND transporter permease subunit [Desulfatitalea alkaliphila]|uniref:Efflux RND transporter permease subunit n=1 Tax=Desulfatitalea alkaliphila TaxID=2929485 RepID=A0AA41UPX0_9BACT|nr:efflux RND transporter permease subunit [Desulfatitalea alkaliphila]MCJ8500863.1 efflux RND transporter permease subunit [Desulfatitalea alkaliphila]